MLQAQIPNARGFWMGSGDLFPSLPSFFSLWLMHALSSRACLTKFRSSALSRAASNMLRTSFKFASALRLSWSFFPMLPVLLWQECRPYAKQAICAKSASNKGADTSSSYGFLLSWWYQWGNAHPDLSEQEHSHVLAWHVCSLCCCFWVDSGKGLPARWLPLPHEIYSNHLGAFALPLNAAKAAFYGLCPKSFCRLCCPPL